ncbi:MAG: hypothetical protein EOO75_04820 [Myxococcales bacterium]|nr:MAG: hypothetical protein EOO75_04820 [Myxococcales bacterium]
MGKASKGERAAGVAKASKPGKPGKPGQAAGRAADGAAGKAGKAERKAGKTHRAASKAAVVAVQERGYTLADAREVLGPVDVMLEGAIRAAHPDEELQKRGSEVGSERIVADGERIASQAVALLLSDDDDVREAARAAGLTRPLVALLVEGLLRLDGAFHLLQDAGTAGRSERQTSAQAIEAATVSGRRLRLETRERLQQVARADSAIALQLEAGGRQPTTADALAGQLDILARLVEGTLGHGDPKIRALVELRGLTADDAKALRQAAGALRNADQASGSDGRAAGAERQARLDILDGYCLVLLRAVFGALRTMAHRTRKVRRPSWVRLRVQMDEHDDEAPVA